MSLHDSSTSNQLLQTYSSQDPNTRKTKPIQWTPTPKPNPEFILSEELQKIKDEYDMLERKNQEELEIIQQQFGDNTFAEFLDFQEFLKKGPGSPHSQETAQNVQTENPRGPKNDQEAENSNADTQNLNEIVEEKFYKVEAEKLAKQEQEMRLERDALKKELEEAQKKFDLQNCFIKELERNNQNLHSKLGKINKEIESEIKTIMFEAQNDKKRYLGTLKKLIELFQLEKLRIKEAFSNLSTDINIEKNQHFQDVEQLKQIIDHLKEEIEKRQQVKAMLSGKGHECQNFEKTDDEKVFAVFQEIEEHRKYAHELEMIIKNLGLDNENLEKENAQLKIRYEEQLQEVIEDAKDSRRKLQEEFDMFKHRYNSFQEVQGANGCVKAENEALKTNLKNIDDKYLRKIRVLEADHNEKYCLMSVQIEKQSLTIEKLNNDVSDLKNFIEKLESDLLNKSNEIANLELDHACVEKGRQDLQMKLEKSRKVIDQKLRDFDEEMTHIKSQEDTEVKKLKAEISRLQKERKNFQTGMIEQETRYKILKVDFDECVLEKDKQLTKFNKEIKMLKEENQEKTNQLNGKISELQAVNLKYEGIEQDLHAQICNLVHNMDQLNYENQQEVDRLKQEVKKQIGPELGELKKFRQELEDQVKLNEKNNILLKSELQFKTQRCLALEEELKELKNSHQDLNSLLEETKERHEEEIEKLKLSNERILKRSKDEIAKLLKEFEQQSLFCDHLDKRKKELERINKNYTDNLEHVTKVYERELEDLRCDLQNTTIYYENKISYSKTENIFEAKKYENRISELEQELKSLKYEVDWLREVHKE